MVIELIAYTKTVISTKFATENSITAAL